MNYRNFFFIALLLIPPITNSFLRYQAKERKKLKISSSESRKYLRSKDPKFKNEDFYSELDLESVQNFLSSEKDFRETQCANKIIQSISSAHKGTKKNDFNSWDIHKICGNKLLKALILTAIKGLDPNGKFLVKDKISKFAEGISELYNEISQVPYHNTVHASDLIQKNMFFLESFQSFNDGNLKLRDYLGLTNLEYLAMMIGASAHDAGHSGDTNYYARIFQTFVGKQYNGILELYSCDLVLGLLLGKELSQSEEYKKYFFIDIFGIFFDEDAETKSKFPVIASYRKKSLHAIKKLRSKYHEGGFINPDLDPYEIKKFLGIIREVIYTTIMNPFDNRYDEYWKSQNFDTKPDPFGIPDGKNSLFHYFSLANSIKPLLLLPLDYYYETVPEFSRKKEKEYYTSEQVYSNKRLKDKFTNFILAEKGTKLVSIPGMKNLEGQSPESQAKWLILGEMNHVSDVGNGLYGFEIMKDWYKMLMKEWAVLDCVEKSYMKNTKGYFLYNPSQKFFQMNMVRHGVGKLAKLFPGFNYNKVYDSGMFDLNKGESLDNNIKPIFEEVKEKYDNDKTANGNACIFEFDELKELDSGDF